MKLTDIQNNLVVILGPTATGKTRFAAELAVQTEAEIISADSRQIYRKMNLGTGKDYDDYRVGNIQVPYHLIDLHEPGYRYNVFEYQQDFLHAYSEITGKDKIPILCGGSGLYIDAVTKGYQLIAVPVNQKLREELQHKPLNELENILSSFKKLHNRTDTDTVKRAIRAIEIETYYSEHPEDNLNYPVLKPVYLGLTCDREIRRKRITLRLKARLKSGMIDEVKQLLEEGLTAEDLMYYGLEYKYITLYLTGKLDYDSMVYKLNIAIHQLAKRQMTWFRKMEREGIKIHWIDSEINNREKTIRALEILVEK